MFLLSLIVGNCKVRYYEIIKYGVSVKCMNVDSIITQIFNWSDILKSEKTNSEFRINKKFVKNNHSSTLKVIIPPWGEGESLVDTILLRRLFNQGYSCLAYFFPKSILSPDISRTRELFEQIKNTVRADISRLKTEHHFQKIDIIATSLGVVSACLIANDNDDVADLYFIVPGSCLAASLWDGIRTKKLKSIYEHQGINREQLVQSWHSLAPKNNINTLRNRNIFIALSRSDRVIPYRYGRELADLVIKQYPNETVVQENSHLGHYLTVVKYYVFDTELLK